MLLYQFAGSHFCEKARWALDYKRLDYRIRNLVPGPHRRTATRLAATSSLPILVDGGTAVQGSAAIIDYLERRQPRPPLNPTHSQDASMAVEWERYLDRNLAPQIRQLFYFHAFRNRAYVTDFLLRGAPWWGRVYYGVAYPAIKRAMTKRLSLTPAAVGDARAKVELAFDRLDERIDGRKYLAGPLFSRADLTAAALLFHWFDAAWAWPPELDDFRRRHGDRPFFHWAAAIYRDFRRPAGRTHDAA